MSLCRTRRHMNMGMYRSTHPLLGVTCRWVFRFTHRLFYPFQRAADTHWLGPRAGLDLCKKRKFSWFCRKPNHEFSSANLWSSHYNDCATRARTYNSDTRNSVHSWEVLMKSNTEDGENVGRQRLHLVNLGNISHIWSSPVFQDVLSPLVGCRQSNLTQQRIETFTQSALRD